MSQRYSYVVSRRFLKNWSKLDVRTKKETVRKIDIFLENPYFPSLKTHKLSGKLKDCWSFSVSHNLRIMFRFGGGKTVEFIDIGSHQIYK
jgi:addiction module RelE/StbE family toxin